MHSTGTEVKLHNTGTRDDVLNIGSGIECLLWKLGHWSPYCNWDQGHSTVTGVKVHNVYNIGTGIEVPTVETGM